MFKKKKCLLAILLIIFVNFSVYSQYRRNTAPKFSDGLSIAGKGGINMFYGDLVDNSRSSYSFGVSLDKEIHKLFSVRTQIMAGKMKGVQMSQMPGETHLPFASFKNFYAEFTVGGTYSILNHALGYYRERVVQPYVLLQLGAIYYDATEYWEQKKYIEWYGTNFWRDASGISPVASIGGGAVFWILHPRLKATLEFYGTYVLGDKVDAHDVWWMIPHEDIIYKTSHNDFYYIGTLGVSFLFNASKFKNDFKYNRKTYNRNRKYLSQKSKKPAYFR